MMTQTHVLLPAALFARPGARVVAAAAILGGLVPDTDVWIMFAIEHALGSTGCEIFHYRYWQPPWTMVQAVVNSMPLYVAILAVGSSLRWAGLRRDDSMANVAGAMMVFAVAALLHVGTDFLLHHDDARRHFWPLSDWVFRSPLSYWDPAYHGDVFVFFEIALGLSLAAILWQRFPALKPRLALALACLGYGLILYASVFGAAVHDKGPGSCDNRPGYWRHG